MILSILGRRCNSILDFVELSFVENGWLRSMCNEWMQLLIISILDNVLYEWSRPVS